MANAPGIGPRLDPEQVFALEVTTRLAYNAPRSELAGYFRRLHHDNMMLRQAILELIDEDQK